ncbi:hypothetical protein KHS38_16400 [Mucilaginibacter sp. Bleaf8]|uniref:hypothetical protein n=1 Tax=Mucilaginibacter sp. Bleaf8 TaxID=2834430 RepID=UPI001BCE2AAF|nr:hypothetical protein [Mucilaginibacter sp. Bleaf8]MBS7565989.1 hypothetical protein [Mucilaginibacter sp. Bleaf8]
MKSRIFNLKALIVCALILATHGSFAQADDKDISKEMNKLQSQMRDLQKQMNKLQSKQFEKQAKELQKSAEKLRGDARVFTYNFKLNDLKTDLGDLKGLSNIVVTPPNIDVAPLTNNFNFSEDAISKKVQSGELKEKVKNYSKSYSVNADDKIQLSNRYGKVTVNTWNKNEVKVDVQVKAMANEDNEAQRLLDGVNITDSKENDVVSFTTSINSTNKENRGSIMAIFFGGEKNTVRRVEVNYTVYMPAKNQLQVSNRYGATVLPDLAGKVIIDNAYGSLVAKSLSNAGNEIVVKYGSATIDNFSGSELNVAYGSLNLGEADKLNATVSYSSAKIGKLKTSGNLNVRYCGGLQIADLGRNLKSLSVNSSYSNIKLGMAENDNADFDITTHYGSFSYGDRPVNIVNKTPGDEERGWSSTKTYKGKLGKGNSDKLIVIRSNYGSVKFD